MASPIVRIGADAESLNQTVNTAIVINMFVANTPTAIHTL